jgi:hypothetical protein
MSGQVNKRLTKILQRLPTWPDVGIDVLVLIFFFCEVVNGSVSVGGRQSDNLPTPRVGKTGTQHNRFTTH